MSEEGNKKYTPSIIAERHNEAIKHRLFHDPTIKDAAFQHSVLCQTSLPYRNPKDLIRWKKEQGSVSLSIQSLEVDHPETGEGIRLGLPFGTKARLIMAHINTEAIKKQSPIIDVEDSMTQFIKRIGLATKGHNYYAVKDQLSRIASSIVTLSYNEGKASYNVNFLMVKKYDLWFPKDSRQRVLWPSYIELTDDYFKNLMEHAIPLDERALAALSNNAMALDIYAWLAQRLHRIDSSKPQFIAWAALKKQFGEGYTRMSDFKRAFRKTLQMVLWHYRRANIEEDKNKGFFLKNSPSPIEQKKIYSLSST